MRWVLLGSVLGLVLLAAAAVLALTLPGSPLKPSSALRDANTACGSKGELSDGDHTLFLDMWGQKPNNGLMSPNDVACVLRKLNTPTYVTTHMAQTRALDGRQTDSWASFEASWTYHPDNGLDVLIREK